MQLGALPTVQVGAQFTVQQVVWVSEQLQVRKCAALLCSLLCILKGIKSTVQLGSVAHCAVGRRIPLSWLEYNRLCRFEYSYIYRVKFTATANPIRQPTAMFMICRIPSDFWKHGTQYLESTGHCVERLLICEYSWKYCWQYIVDCRVKGTGSTMYYSLPAKLTEIPDDGWL